MNTELKEKMQKAAEKISSLQSDEIFKQLIEVVFMSGSTEMYAELAPLVEWVSVEDRLPETGKIVLLKNDLEDISTGCFTGKIFKIDFDEISSKKVTHWRRIEL